MNQMLLNQTLQVANVVRGVALAGLVAFGILCFVSALRPGLTGNMNAFIVGILSMGLLTQLAQVQIQTIRRLNEIATAQRSSSPTGAPPKEGT